MSSDAPVEDAAAMEVDAAPVKTEEAPQTRDSSLASDASNPAAPGSVGVKSEQRTAEAAGALKSSQEEGAEVQSAEPPEPAFTKELSAAGGSGEGEEDSGDELFDPSEDPTYRQDPKTAEVKAKAKVTKKYQKGKEKIGDEKESDAAAGGGGQTQSQNKKRKASNKQSYPPTRPGDIATGLELWKKVCSAGIGLENAETGKGEQMNVSAEARRKAAGIPLPPNLDEAVAMLGQAPLDGLASAAAKQGAATDGPVQVRKLVQSLTSEIATTKKALLKAEREKKDREKREAEEQDGSGDDSERGKSKGERKKNAAVVAETEDKEEQEDWVQCDQCLKWRRLPKRSHPNYPEDLPESWNCSMNNWDKNSSCSKPEESFTVSKELSAGAVKIRIWARRLKAADKYEKQFSRVKGSNSTSAIINGGSIDRDFGDVDWIRCSNPTCGKWRACLRNMDARVLKEANPTWYCWMNSWDDTRASCTAPQEGTAVRSLVSRKAWAAPQTLEEITKSNASSANFEPSTPRRVKAFTGTVRLYADELEGNDDWDGDEEELADAPEKEPETKKKSSSSSSSQSADQIAPPLTLKSISSKGRIVRSRFNTREVVQGRR